MAKAYYYCDDKVKQCLFGMEDDKAPRPDSFTVKFFKKAWDVVGSNMI